MDIVRFWLLLLASLAPILGADWTQRPGFRYHPVTPAQPGKTGFTRLDPKSTGILFTNVLVEERTITNRTLLTGSGVAAGDVDGDGLCDLYLSSIDGNNALYRNLGGWKFEDITARAGVACPNQDSTGALLADIDGDGDLDLLVASLDRGLRVFINDGKGKFSEETAARGIRPKPGATSIALADVDGDGDLDLYVARYRKDSIQDRVAVKFSIARVNGINTVVSVDGTPTTDPSLTNRFIVSPSGEVIELGEVDSFYLNDGAGNFTEQSWVDGRFVHEDGTPMGRAPQEWGLAVQFHDIDGDGAPDIYVCNDFSSPDRIWLNDGKGNFREMAWSAVRHTSHFSMGVDFADIDRDGNVDLFVVDMLSRDPAYRQVQVADLMPQPSRVGLFANRIQAARNTLNLNRGDGSFAEIALHAGVAASDWSWSPIFLDVDLDGYEDILIANGQWGDFINADMAAQIERLRASRKMSHAEVAQLVKQYPRLATPNVAFRNNGNLTFTEMGGPWGFNDAVISEGMALADLDNDGDLDVIVNNINDQAGIYRNDSGAGRVAIQLKGRAPNTKGIGAKVTVRGGPVTQAQEIISGGHYLSSDPAMRTFATGTATDLTVEVAWRDGRGQVFNNVPANAVVEIAEPEDAKPIVQDVPVVAPLFQDVSRLIDHTHREEPFDDFERQPLLPNRLSQDGPGIAWLDVDRDGFEDLFIGGGRGGALGAFRNNGAGGFVAMPQEMWKKPLVRDLAGLAGFGGTLLAASSNFEDGRTNGGAARVYAFAQGISGESIFGQNVTAGPIALADVDGDGDLDFFIGGRSVPGRYPEPADSVLMRNNGGKFALAQRFERLGMATSAVFSDLNDDGRPDLIVALEWGEIRTFLNENGALKEKAFPGLAGRTGRWTAIATGDFDNDGRMDIVAANWGSNTKYALTSGHRIYFGDFDDNGSLDVLEAGVRSDGILAPERGFKALGEALPFLKERFPTFAAFSKASVQDVLGKAFAAANVVEMNTLAAMVFLNRGDRFEPSELPVEAQLAPAMGVAVADFDGDGAQDIFLAQNFYAHNGDTFRDDAGRGLLLRGDGRGKFVALSGTESGLKIYGDQRGCAAADYDGDGRIDLAVAQNGAATKLFRNERAKPGLRVRLIGREANPSAVGAKVRLDGAAQEVQAGSGRYSQNGQTLVVARPKEAAELKIRWPTGKKTTRKIEPSENEIVLEEPR